LPKPKDEECSDLFGAHLYFLGVDTDSYYKPQNVRIYLDGKVILDDFDFDAGTDLYYQSAYFSTCEASSCAYDEGLFQLEGQLDSTPEETSFSVISSTGDEVFIFDSDYEKVGDGVNAYYDFLHLNLKVCLPAAYAMDPTIHSRSKTLAVMDLVRQYLLSPLGLLSMEFRSPASAILQPLPVPLLFLVTED